LHDLPGVISIPQNQAFLVFYSRFLAFLLDFSLVKYVALVFVPNAAPIKSIEIRCLGIRLAIYVF